MSFSENDTVTINDVTVNEMLKLFLKKIGREDCLNEEKLGFNYCGNSIKLNDLRKIKELFKNDQDNFSIVVYIIKNLQKSIKYL